MNKEFKYDLEKRGAFSGNEKMTFHNKDKSLDFDQEEHIRKILKKIVKSQDFREKLKKKSNEYDQLLKKYGNYSDIQVNVVAHTHVDIAWLWNRDQTRRRITFILKKILRSSSFIGKKFCITLSQPLIFEWIKKDAPFLFRRLKSAVKKGKIELIGGSYIEPDVMMPSEESLIRQRLYGMRFYRDNFQKLPCVEWLYDSFGFNNGLPQIFRKTNVKYFWTMKMTWNKNTTFPFVNFWWEGVDGSRILMANFPFGTQLFEEWEKYEIGHHLLEKNQKYIGSYEEDYSELEKHLLKGELCPILGLFFGKSNKYGPRYAETLFFKSLIEINPKFKWSNVESFFKGIEKYSERFPIWKDELYLETHRGSFSVQAKIKRMNRYLENLLCSIEIFCSIICLHFNDFSLFPIRDLEKLWKLVLTNQFHDTLPGTSIPEVFDDVSKDWEMLNLGIIKIQQKFLQYLSYKVNPHILIYNSLPWERTDRIFIPNTVLIESKIHIPNLDRLPYFTLELLGDNKKKYVLQPVGRDSNFNEEINLTGWWTVVNLPPFSIIPAKISILEDEIDKTPLLFEENKLILSNNLLEVQLDPKTGGISSLKMKNVNQNKNLLKGDFNNLTEAFKDQTRIYPAWDMCPDYWNHKIELLNDENVIIKLREHGPILIKVEVSRTLGSNHNPITQTYTLFRDLPLLFCEYHSDWHQKNIMLKVGLETETNAEKCTADTGYGIIERRTVPITPADKARFEKICHMFYDISCPNNEWGIATLNEGKYGFDANGNKTRITMLRTPNYPEPIYEAWINSERQVSNLKLDRTLPSNSGIGPFYCNYAYLPHSGGCLRKVDGTINVIVRYKSLEFNNPIQVLNFKPTNKKKISFSSLETSPILIESPNIFVNTLKMNEWESRPTIILRICEIFGVEGMVSIFLKPQIVKNIVRIIEVDMLERINGSIKSVEYHPEQDKLHIFFNKYEIKTLEFFFR